MFGGIIFEFIVIFPVFFRSSDERRLHMQGTGVGTFAGIIFLLVNELLLNPQVIQVRKCLLLLKDAKEK